MRERWVQRLVVALWASSDTKEEERRDFMLIVKAGAMALSTGKGRAQGVGTMRDWEGR